MDAEGGAGGARPGTCRPAIHCYLDAAEAALRSNRGDQALVNYRRALSPQRDNDLDRSTSRRIAERLEYDPGLMALLELAN